VPAFVLFPPLKELSRRLDANKFLLREKYHVLMVTLLYPPPLTSFFRPDNARNTPPTNFPPTRQEKTHHFGLQQSCPNSGFEFRRRLGCRSRRKFAINHLRGVAFGLWKINTSFLAVESYYSTFCTSTSS
jgi:hypothetical protein